MEKRVFDIDRLCRVKPMQTLIALNEGKSRYCSKLAREINCTYSYVAVLTNDMEQGRLLECKQVGRVKVLTLTKMGEDIANHLKAIQNLLAGC